MRGFTHIDTWIFDLDNTLYPASCRLFDQIHQRMTSYLMNRFSLAHDEARQMQRDMFYKYGTTLRGLMVEHGEKPDAFLNDVHNIDYSPVNEDKLLQAALQNLPGRKLVFTAGTVDHATRAMNRLGVTEIFEAIFDITDAGHIPKPERAPYDKFISQLGVNGTRSAFFEDIARNLEVPHAMGMTTVLVTDDENNDAQHLNKGVIGEHVHHTTSHLAGFLQGLVEEGN